MDAIIITNLAKNTIEIEDEDSSEILHLSDEQYELLANGLDELIVDAEDIPHTLLTEYTIGQHLDQNDLLFDESEEDYDRFDDLCYQYNI